LDQRDLYQQGEHERCRWGSCQAFVAWELLGMRVQGEPDLALPHAVDQQAEHRQHRQGRDPFGLLQPHGGNRRGMLEPAKAGCYSGLLVLIGLENVRLVRIYSDHDANQTGQQAAEVLARRLRQEGRIAWIYVPRQVGMDWLDVRNAEREARA
jgi:hypothetical protein